MRILQSRITSVDYDNQLYMPLALGQTKGLTLVSAPSPIFFYEEILRGDPIWAMGSVGTMFLDRL